MINLIRSLGIILGRIVKKLKIYNDQLMETLSLLPRLSNIQEILHLLLSQRREMNGMTSYGSIIFASLSIYLVIFNLNSYFSIHIACFWVLFSVSICFYFIIKNFLFIFFQILGYFRKILDLQKSCRESATSSHLCPTLCPLLGNIKYACTLCYICSN